MSSVQFSRIIESIVIVSWFVSIDRATPRKAILVKSNYVLVSIIWSRKERHYYEDSDKPTLLVA